MRREPALDKALLVSRGKKYIPYLRGIQLSSLLILVS